MVPSEFYVCSSSNANSWLKPHKLWFCQPIFSLIFAQFTIVNFSYEFMCFASAIAKLNIEFHYRGLIHKYLMVLKESQSNLRKSQQVKRNKNCFNSINLRKSCILKAIYGLTFNHFCSTIKLFDTILLLCADELSNMDTIKMFFVPTLLYFIKNCCVERINSKFLHFV